ncbi:MAG TPA: hypothetical protein VKV17_01405 [Bryobacteraceae bacterium]|nr:hypothetical protein [Bryobacteraceae bacterium]
MPAALHPPQTSTLSLPQTETAQPKALKLTRVAYGHLLISAVLVLLGTLYLLSIQQGFPWGDDYALYFAHAQNLAGGHSYSATGYLYNPAEPEIGPPAYPPLLPILLAPVFRVAGYNPQLLKLDGILLLLAALWAISRYLRHFLPPGYTAIILLVLGLSPYCSKYLTNSPASDIPFLCLFFLLLERLLVASRTHWKKRSDAIWIGVLLYLCCACRTIGVILFPCLLAAELIRASAPSRRFALPRGLWISVAIGGIGAAVQGWLLPGQQAYLHMLNFELPTLIEYVKAYAWSVRYKLFAVPGVSGWLLLLLLAALGLLGFFLTLRSGAAFPQIFTVIYLAMIGIWTVDQDLRFLLPVLPLWLLDCCEAIFWLQRRKGFPKAVAAGALGAILILYAPHVGHTPAGAVPDLRTAGTNSRGFQEIAGFVRENTSPEARIVFSKPKLLAFFTGRQCVVYPKTDAQAIIEYLKSIHADYLVASRAFDSDRTLLFPLASEQPNLLEPVYQSNDAAVFRVRVRE